MHPVDFKEHDIQVPLSFSWILQYHISFSVFA